MRERIDALRAKMLDMPLCTALLFLPFFEPVCLGELFAPSYLFFAGWKALSILTACVFFLSRPKVSAITVVMGVYQVVLMVCTLINHSAFIEWAYKAGVTAGVCLLVDQCIDTNAKAMIKGLFFSLGTLCVINLATVIVFRGGVTAPGWYFLGLDNVHALYLIPVTGIAELYAFEKGWPYIVRLGLAILFAAALYITWSVTGMLAMTALVVLLALYRVPKSYRLCNIYVYYAALAAAFVLIVILRVPEHFSSLIESVLHKDSSLTHRIPLWQNVLGLIKDRPLLGHGRMEREAARALMGQIHCHNLILQTLFETGVVGMAVFLVQMGLIGRSLWRTRKSFIGYALAAAMCSMFIYCMAEGLNFPAGYICLCAICYHAEDVVRALEPPSD